MKASLQLGGSVVTAVSILVAESLALEAWVRPAEASLTWWWATAPVALVLNCCLSLLVWLGFAVMTGRPNTATLLAAAVLLALGGAHAATLSTLGRPLFPWDVLLFREALNLTPYLEQLAGRWVFASVVVVLIAALAASLKWGPRLGRRSRALAGVVLAALALWLTPSPGASLGAFDVHNMTWDQLNNYRINGLSLAFLMNLPVATVHRPANYTRDNIGLALSRGKAHDIDAAKPDVIVVMSESFFDVTRLPGVSFKEDPLPNLHRLQREAASGALVTPTFGGGTANTEFEFLTGHSMRFLPRGSVPYQQYVRRDLRALPGILRDHGYRTEAVHIFHRWFWDREQVYQRLGVDRFVSMEGLDLTGGGYFPHDENLTREMIKTIDAASQPLFLFGISVEAHGPYEAHRYERQSVQFDGPLDGPARDELATYCEAITNADAQLGALVEYLERRGRPAVLMFFGDHLPSLPLTLRQTGLAPSPQEFDTLPLSRRAVLYEVPLVMWNSERQGSRTLGLTSAPFLMPLILQETATVGTPYTEFLDRVREQYPVVTPDFLADANGKFLDEPPSDWPGIEGDWRLLQYDALFGQNYAHHQHLD